MKVLKKLLSCIFILALVPSIVGCDNNAKHLERTDWNETVKTAVNDFIDEYGNKSSKYNKNSSYVVSDFDNTAAIFDMCEQFMIYQAEVMGYGFTPEELPTILSSGLGSKDVDLSSYGYGLGTYNDWISDITSAYTHLYTTYGPFTGAGVSEDVASKIQADDMWAEFTAKMMNMYYLITDYESAEVSYPWITYWYTGMTEQEVYDLAKQSHAKYSLVDTSQKTITSPDIDSKVGVSSYTYIEGVQVTENTKELWQCLDEAGIDVWVCTASEVDLIRAAVDEFGLHDYCKGVIGMTPNVVNGKLSYTYDYNTGYCWYADKDNTWTKGDKASKTQTQGEGKVTAIENICAQEYGCGPLAGFMDSTGDFNFCSEFNNLKLVICFNRADRKVTDGGSLIAETAIYQNNQLGYDLKTANAAGDTYYVLQGRDENGKRTLRDSDRTIKYGSDKEQLFKEDSSYTILGYMINSNMTTKEALNTFSIKTSADDPNNLLGFKYGFLDSYSGYHSK